MSNWRAMRLDQLGTVERGRSRHRPRNDPSLYGGDYPFVQTGDVKAAGLRLFEYEQTYNEVGLAQSRLWPVGTLCVTIAANIGDTTILGIPACFPDSIVGFTPYADKADVVFVKYALDYAKIRFAAISKGATQDNLSLEKLLSQDLLVPPLETQRRVAGILSAYDDLIEVNRRRIAVLDEMARGLLQDLILDSQTNSSGHLPLSEFVLKTLGGDWGTEEPDEYHTVAVRVVRGTDFSRLQSGDFDSCPTRFIKPASANKRLLKPYDVILENSINAKTRSAGSTIIATPGMIEALGGSVVAASFCRVFQLARPEDAVLFHMWCRHLHASGEIARYQVVAANGIANFQTTQFVRDCVLPFNPTSYEKQLDFLVSLLAPTYAQQIANLAAARDLLLPRLISGQLSVTQAERELEAA